MKTPAFSEAERARRSRAATAFHAARRRLKLQELTSGFIASGLFTWCRARLFHALGAAARQGVLQEVLDEFELEPALIGQLTARLSASAWGRAP